ncbi:MAG: DUF4921 family protein [Candidatus Yanofskybacteria bacterium]|nr:DUF4921 family protein [Candidatus Yanofskybacteria bacterium]
MNKPEFRQDLVSGEWVLFAPARKKHLPDPATLPALEQCPFDNLNEGQEILWSYPETNPVLTVIKNKYPAVTPGLCTPIYQIGPFQAHEGAGSHDVFVYTDHNTRFTDLTKEQFVQVIQAYKKRYQEIAELKDCTRYILLFHNFGKEAGASIAHPHSQIISMPILPPDVAHSLQGAHNFYQKNGKQVYEVMIQWEKEQAKRIVYENDSFIAFCPFVSKYPFEVRIFPKESHAHFERMPETSDPDFADVVQVVLKKLKKALNNPAYNFFIHTAPLESDPTLHQFYCWHMEVLPRLRMDAGFEMGTGIVINVVDPDEAAALLRDTQV